MLILKVVLFISYYSSFNYSMYVFINNRVISLSNIDAGL